MVSRLLVLMMLLAPPAVTGATVIVSPDARPRVHYGAAKLAEACAQAGTTDGRIDVIPQTVGSTLGPEGFRLISTAAGEIRVLGGDDSGALYGCLELARRVRESGKLPLELDFSDAPAMKLRGPCIGMQKTNILPGRKVYEYPYTPELFPFFYDKSFWQEYLDFLAQNRFNTLFLWNGHPFASLVKLVDYPYALEVPEDVFQKNVEMFRYITQEADKRGIWVVQMFYSIILSKPFAERNGLETQLAESTPLVDDYMRKSIVEFVKQYPHVGLMPCLGEALQGQENQNRWLTQVILPAVKEGARAAGLREQPPVVIRTHATDLRTVMEDALRVYSNLYTEAKFNGESLTTWEPRGVRQDVHLAMSRLGSTHLINVHILANLEPFRYGAQRFIQKSVQAGRDRLGARGLHLYPLAYWSWPDAPDKMSPPLKQWQRDWIWFEAWARYAWNPDVDPESDRAYWIARLAEMYGSKEAAEKILAAYNDSGECAPRILRRFGITEGNRQTMSLGMTLDQLVDPSKYRPYPELWESQSPPGERLQEYVEREWKKQPHEGETPPQIIDEVLEFSARAVQAVDAAAGLVTRNKAELLRLRNDVHCIRAMSQNYTAKANAAIFVLRYRHSNDVADMEQAASFLAESLNHYRKLARLTKESYHFANTMQTSQRKIPFTGGIDGQPAHYHWVQLVPLYEKELDEFRAHVRDLKSGTIQARDETAIAPLPKAAVTLHGAAGELYEVKVGAKPWTDRGYVIESLAPELHGLQGIRFSHESAKNGKYVAVEFETSEPVQVLIGYFKESRELWLKPPDLETDALAAERGGVEPLITNAATISASPAVDVYAMSFDKGRHKLEVRGRGSFVVLGIVPKSAKIDRRDAELKGGK